MGVWRICWVFGASVDCGVIKDHLATLGANKNIYRRPELVKYLPDVYDPTFTCDVLLKPDSLGHVIFGVNTWRKLRPEITNAQFLDPLTDMFLRVAKSKFCICMFLLLLMFCCFCLVEYGAPIEQNTRLVLDKYDYLFEDSNSKTWPRCKPYAIMGGDKQVWSISPLFPVNVRAPK